MRTISRHNKDGPTTYIQLVHNVRDFKTAFSNANVLYTFRRGFFRPNEGLKEEDSVDGWSARLEHRFKVSDEVNVMKLHEKF